MMYLPCATAYADYVVAENQTGITCYWPRASERMALTSCRHSLSLSTSSDAERAYEIRVEPVPGRLCDQRTPDGPRCDPPGVRRRARRGDPNAGIEAGRHVPGHR
jgi:hypothetical protein